MCYALVSTLSEKFKSNSKLLTPLVCIVSKICIMYWHHVYYKINYPLLLTLNVRNFEQKKNTNKTFKILDVVFHYVYILHRYSWSIENCITSSYCISFDTFNSLKYFAINHTNMWQLSCLSHNRTTTQPLHLNPAPIPLILKGVTTSSISTMEYGTACASART